MVSLTNTRPSDRTEDAHRRELLGRAASCFAHDFDNLLSPSLMGAELLAATVPIASAEATDGRGLPTCAHGASKGSP